MATSTPKDVTETITKLTASVVELRAMLRRFYYCFGACILLFLVAIVVLLMKASQTETKMDEVTGNMKQLMRQGSLSRTKTLSQSE